METKRPAVIAPPVRDGTGAYWLWGDNRSGERRTVCHTGTAPQQAGQSSVFSPLPPLCRPVCRFVNEGGPTPRRHTAAPC